MSSPVENLVSRLQAKRSGAGWIAKCPAHEDHKPSLSISEGADGRAWLKCFAGCSTESVLAALGLTIRDLFPATHRQSSGKNSTTPRSPRLKVKQTNDQIFDWRECVLAFNDQLAEQIAEERAFSLAFVKELRAAAMIGRVKGLVAFPVYHGNKIVGAHYGLVDCRTWNYEPKGISVAPLVFGEIADRVHIFESSFSVARRDTDFAQLTTKQFRRKDRLNQKTMENKQEDHLTESSPDGAPPVNRVSKIVEHPEEDQLNPEDFRIDQSELDQPVAKTILTTMPVKSRPESLQFVRVHPDPKMRSGLVSFIALKQSREYYLVAPALRSELRPREYSIGQIFLAIDRLDHPFLWIVTLQSPTGRISDWYTSQLDCVERAMHEWIQVVADQDAGVYTASVAEDDLGEPEWPKQSFGELFKIGFKRRTVTSLDHPVFKQLRGRV